MVSCHCGDKASALGERLIAIIYQHKVVSGSMHLGETYLSHF
jgi:hypothetical protein